MFALFPVILGILIGFSLDDGDINRKDIKQLADAFEKDVEKPLIKKISIIKKGFAKAFKDVKEVPIKK